jgi:hypothetical protein
VGFLQAAVSKVRKHIVLAHTSFAIGTASGAGIVIGPYRLLERIGQGGMGIRRTHISLTKTPESEAAVPVLPMVQAALQYHRDGNPNTTYIFEGEHKASADELGEPRAT